jgi:hypothetical protein
VRSFIRIERNGGLAERRFVVKIAAAKCEIFTFLKEARLWLFRRQGCLWPIGADHQSCCDRQLHVISCRSWMAHPNCGASPGLTVP